MKRQMQVAGSPVDKDWARWLDSVSMEDVAHGEDLPGALLKIDYYENGARKIRVFTVVGCGKALLAHVSQQTLPIPVSSGPQWGPKPKEIHPCNLVLCHAG